MKKDELFTIKQAILNEVEGYEFYKMAERQAENEDAKESFSILASEEMKHAQYLKELFDKMKNEGEDFELAYLSDPPSPHIYDWTNYKFKKPSMAMSIYGTAVNLEKASIDFYETAKENTKNEEAGKLFDMLIRWENIHLQQFQKAYEISKEDWWNDQGYAPF
jgi:rubrerythrin